METVKADISHAAQSGAYQNSTVALVMIKLYESMKGSFVGKETMIGLEFSRREALKH